MDRRRATRARPDASPSPALSSIGVVKAEAALAEWEAGAASRKLEAVAEQHLRAEAKAARRAAAAAAAPAGAR